MLNILQHGDILEKAYYKTVLVSFPQYEILWQRIVGNDGNAHIIESGNSNLDDLRKDIAQHSYTVYESLVSLFRISNKAIKVENVEHYLDANNDFILFQTHCGRIRDCVHKIGSDLSIEKLENGLKDFYKRRNHVLHSKKLPFTIIEEMLLMPKVQGADFNPHEWHDDLRWEDIDPNDLEIVSDIYSELYTEILSCLNSIYSRILSTIADDPQFETIVDLLEDHRAEEYSNVNPSGIIDNHTMADISM
jgi:hypothetical protein